MKFVLQATLSFGLLAVCLALSPVRWCTTSDNENAKCLELKECLTAAVNTEFPSFSCVRKADPYECIRAIAASEADAISLDGGHIFDAGQTPYNLKPIAAEVYGTTPGQESITSYYAVAVVKKGTAPSLCQLKGKKSCHTGLGRSAGWVIPVGTLLKCGCIEWQGVATSPVTKPVAQFFTASCVPGAPKDEPTLCRLCQGAGDDKCTFRDPYAGYSGAFKCMTDGAGDVAFVKHTTALDLSPQERSKYELICGCNGGTKPVEEYKTCHLARVPAHAVVARSVDGRADEIWTVLSKAQELYPNGTTGKCRVFGSSRGKDLMFKDNAFKLVRTPPLLDSQLYLGYDYWASVTNLRKERPSPDSANKIKWCAVGRPEQEKCDSWSIVSGGAIDCSVADVTTDGCMIKILKGEADAMTLDGGHVYTAGVCGLVPVLAEVYDESACNQNRGSEQVSYYAVAVVKKSNRDITWNTLKGKKSCHTGVDRTAGWNVPVGLIYKETGSCDVDKFFSEGCAPGSPPNSPLCKLCVGSGSAISNASKCAANNHELYYGYSGALRCLIEKGDVAFVKHTTVSEYTGPTAPAWAKGLTANDFELLCPNGERRSVDLYRECNLAKVPTHGVVTRPERAAFVRQVLNDQQSLYGSTGSQTGIFKMFQSENGKDLLFKDGTKCLAATTENYKDFLGQQYLDSTSALKKCSPSELLKACSFHHHE